jgi:uncharacterized membrane protein YfcA
MGAKMKALARLWDSTIKVLFIILVFDVVIFAGGLLLTDRTCDRVYNGVALGSITIVTVFGTLIAQVRHADSGEISVDQFRVSIAAGIIVAYSCLLCILVFSRFNPSPAVFHAFSWVAGVVLTSYFATSTVDKLVERAAAGRKPRQPPAE